VLWLGLPAAAAARARAPHAAAAAAAARMRMRVIPGRAAGHALVRMRLRRADEDNRRERELVGLRDLVGPDHAGLGDPQRPERLLQQP